MVFHTGADSAIDHPKSQSIIDLLMDGFKQDAAAKKIKATALAYDMLVVPPGAMAKSDAVAVALDHRDNYSMIVIFSLRPGSRKSHGWDSICAQGRIANFPIGTAELTQPAQSLPAELRSSFTGGFGS